MIGTAYWYTGVRVTHCGGKWGASLEFLDDGFCQDASTQGTLTTRYYLPSLTQAIDTLIADATRLGFVSCAATTPVWIHLDADDPGVTEGWPPDWRRIIGEEAARRGWACRQECADAAKGAA